MKMPVCVETDEKGSPFVTLGPYQLRLELENISGEFEEKARTELLETPERLQQGLERLRELIKVDKGLSLPVEDDKFLTKFLRPFKCNAEQSFKIMRKFYKFKLKYPKYGGVCVTPEGVRHVFDSEVFVFLPTRSKSGGRIMIINAGSKWKPKEVTLEYMFKSIMVAIEIAMMEPKTQVGGVNVILNMEGLSMSHVCQFSPSMAKLIVDWVQECAPVRLRGLHVVNQPYLFNMLYALFKPLLGEHLKKMLSFHGKDFKSLCDKIGSDSLPPYFGGNAKFPEYPGSIFSDMLFYYQHEFKEFQTYGYFTESKDCDLMASHNGKNTVINTCGQPG
ncbi:alpha-tocopherol transfer protein-like isoform X2 [Euwallacea fornicatus]